MVKIISGGQTGIDQIGLEIAKDLGYETGGWMPRNWITEDGARPDIGERYGMKECGSSYYPIRTEQNVEDSDITLIFNRSMGTGSRLTQRLCKKHGKPCIINPTHIALNKYDVINIAGTRGSRLTIEDMEYFRKEIRSVLASGTPNGE